MSPESVVKCLLVHWRSFTQKGKPAFQVADILHAVNLPDIISNTRKLRTLYAVSKCRTAALGGHIDRCDHRACNRLHLSYNSCRNRHCPKCQGHQREEWIQKREVELLNVPYFHVVFTLPDHLNELCLYKPDVLYAILIINSAEIKRCCISCT